jgi:thymidine phosphorylase
MDDKSKHLQAVEAIKKKLLGKKLSYKEILNLMDEIAHMRLGNILTAYFVAAGFTSGFTDEELYYLTKAIVETGTQLSFEGIVADKHSIGGVTGRVTMVFVPIIAAAGFKIPKTSSRAITSPAGTADVMEMFCNVTFTPHQIEHIVNKVGGCVVWGGHLGIAPADDVIIKVEEPLALESYDKFIVSIMAKKIAVGANHLILDIPVGKTMKVRHKTGAHEVSQKFAKLADHFHIKMIPYIQEVHQPVGLGIGPYLEGRDVLSVLQQHKDRPLLLEQKVITLAGKLLDLCYKEANMDKDGEAEAKRILTSGLAFKKFQEIVDAQGGNGDIDLATFKGTTHKKEVHATQSGTIREINHFNLNSIAKVLGAPKDKYAGILLHKRLYDKVYNKESLMLLHSTNPYHLKEAEETIKSFPIYIIE